MFEPARTAGLRRVGLAVLPTKVAGEHLDAPTIPTCGRRSSRSCPAATVYIRKAGGSSPKEGAAPLVQRISPRPHVGRGLGLGVGCERASLGSKRLGMARDAHCSPWLCPKQHPQGLHLASAAWS